jgi:hypothetical protein
MKIDRRVLGFIGCVALLVFTVECSEAEAPEGEPISFSAPPAAPSGGLAFTTPDGWVEETPSSGMRRLQYRLPASAGDAEVAVFADIGGTPEQNISRWISQFTTEDGGSVADEAKVTQEEIGGFNVTILDVEGTYGGAMSAPMAGQGGGASPGYRMLAAVIDTGSGPWFVKLTGLKGSVAEWEDSFHEFVKSAKLE